jgi:hypothetical protein
MTPPYLTPIAVVPPDLAAKPACPLVEALRRIEPATAPQLARSLGVRPKSAACALRRREDMGAVIRCGWVPNGNNRQAILWRAA